MNSSLLERRQIQNSVAFSEYMNFTYFYGIRLLKGFEKIVKMCKLNGYGSFETHSKFSNFNYLVSVGLNKINYQVTNKSSD